MARAHALVEVAIPPGDTEAFIAAVASANERSEPTLIRLASNGTYRINLAEAVPEPIQGHLIVEGQNAEFTGDGAPGFGQLFEVEAGAFLELRNLYVHSFDSGENFAGGSSFGLISIDDLATLKGSGLRFENMYIDLDDRLRGAVFTNLGRLILDGVRVTNITVGLSSGVIIWNSGTARIQNLLVADSAQVAPEDSESGGFLLSNIAPGHIEILYSTLMANSDLTAGDPEVASLTGGGNFGIQSTATLKASMFIGLACPRAQSLGFNLTTDPTCPLDGPGDQVGVTPAPLSVVYDNGLEVIPLAGSPALDGVTRRSFECVASDAIGTRRPQDGNGDGKSRCDIGAFEAPGPTNMPLFAGGESGLYFDLGQDGHYVSVMEVRPDEYVITWNTFDRDGHQAWVLAIGTREGDTITAQGYFQPDGVLIPGGGAAVDTSALQNWGTVTIHLENCLEGEFIYESNLARFGSGSFPLDRLAFVEGLGCREDGP